MTRKDYILIADAFAKEIDWLTKSDQQSSVQSLSAIKLLAVRLTTQLQADNPRFDRAKFLTACGL